MDLTLHERITQRSDIDCPGDTISYNCSVESNSETVELTWIITLPNEFAPINITYNSTSLLNQRDQLDIYVNSTLTEYTHDQYIETLITFTLFEDVDINGTELQCRSSDLDSVIVEVFANITGNFFFKLAFKYFSNYLNSASFSQWISHHKGV